MCVIQSVLGICFSYILFLFCFLLDSDDRWSLVFFFGFVFFVLFVYLSFCVCIFCVSGRSRFLGYFSFVFRFVNWGLDLVLLDFFIGCVVSFVCSWVCVS